MHNLYRYMRRVLGLAFPMAWSRFIQMFSWFAGMLMLARLGEDVLAASALINAVQIAVVVSFMSILFSTAVVAARLYGAQNYHAIGVLFREGLTLGFLLALVMMLVLYFVGHILLWCGQAPALVHIVERYFHAFAWCALPLMTLVITQQLCYGIGQQRLVIYNNMLSLLVFIPVCYWFIYGGLGLPAFGVCGLAYAIFVQCVFNASILLYCLWRKADFKRYHFFAWQPPHGFHYMKQIYRVGWPMCIQFGGELVAFLVITLFTGWLGEIALSATQVAQQVVLLFLVPLFAVAEAAGIFVSQSIGAKQFDQVKRMGNACIALGVVFVGLLSIAFFVIPEPLTAMYLDVHDPANLQTVKLARWLFYWSAPMLLMDTLRNLYAGALRGFYDTQVPMWIGLGSIWLIVVPCAYVFAFWFHGGVVGIRMAFVLGFAVGAGLLYRRWRLKNVLI